jgi:hypothetical protein
MKLWEQPRGVRNNVDNRIKQLKRNIAEGKDRTYRAQNMLDAAKEYTTKQEHELKKLLDAYELS